MYSHHKKAVLVFLDVVAGPTWNPIPTSLYMLKLSFLDFIGARILDLISALPTRRISMRFKFGNELSGMRGVQEIDIFLLEN